MVFINKFLSFFTSKQQVETKFKCSSCNSCFKYRSNCNEHEYCWH